MPQTATRDLTTVLNQQVANWSVLFIKLHNYHWFVKGEQFFVLHDKFEEMYNEAATHIDELAERLLMINQKPKATLKEYLETATIAEATGHETTNQMVRQISDDFEVMIGELKTGISVAEDEGDDVTADMLIAIRNSLEKHVWMLKSFLKD
jgi:starvation-inducible DNA-binding protein